MTSLRTRAVTTGVLWAFVTIVLALAGLGSFMDAQVQARFIDALQIRHTQAVVAVANYGDSPEFLDRGLSDPVFRRPFSGEYWQVEREFGEIYVSPSLVDDLLPVAGTHEDHDDPDGGDVTTRQFIGPGEETVLGLSQWVVMDDGSHWYIQVASSLQTLDSERTELRNTLLKAFAIVAGVGVIGALAQVAMMLQPLNALRKEVAARWDDEGGLKTESYPVEVAPLVTDINGLMERNRDIISRSRRQAADLAHAVKTPSAIVRNELDALASQGTDVSEAMGALDRLDGQLKRSFARMRADDSSDTIGALTDLDTALGRMQRAFTALARNAGREFSADFDAGMRIRMDQNDFEEVMGNLLDNAVKWSRSQLRLTAKRSGKSQVTIMIADDGPGVPADQLAQVVKGGHRLDTSVPGTGLGLAIAADLIVAYGGDYALGRSDELGGFAFTMNLPVSGAFPKTGRPQKDPPTRG